MMSTKAEVEAILVDLRVHSGGFTVSTRRDGPGEPDEPLTFVSPTSHTYFSLNPIGSHKRHFTVALHVNGRPETSKSDSRA
jgi:hypothetical protein